MQIRLPTSHRSRTVQGSESMQSASRAQTCPATQPRLGSQVCPVEQRDGCTLWMQGKRRLTLLMH